MPEKLKKKEKIKIDKEDWDLVIRSFKDVNEKYKLLFNDIKFIKEELDKKKEGIIPQPLKVGTSDDDVFFCATLHFGVPETIQELAQQKISLEEFKVKLEKLMRGYKIGQTQAQILKKL